MVWHGRHLLVSALRKVLWEADQADEVLGIADVQVAAIVAVHGASVPWGRLRADGVTVVPARRLPDLLQALPADPWARAGGLAGRPSPAAVPRRRLTACQFGARSDCCLRLHRGGCWVRLTAFDHTTGTVLTRCSARRATISLSGVAGSSVITLVGIMSRTRLYVGSFLGSTPKCHEIACVACAVGPMVTLVVLSSLEDSWRRRQTRPQRCERRHARQDVMVTEE